MPGLTGNTVMHLIVGGNRTLQWIWNNHQNEWLKMWVIGPDGEQVQGEGKIIRGPRVLKTHMLKTDNAELEAVPETRIKSVRSQWKAFSELNQGDILFPMKRIVESSRYTYQEPKETYTFVLKNGASGFILDQGYQIMAD